jgi:hypothetical protein
MLKQTVGRVYEPDEELIIYISPHLRRIARREKGNIVRQEGKSFK